MADQHFQNMQVGYKMGGTVGQEDSLQGLSETHSTAVFPEYDVVCTPFKQMMKRMRQAAGGRLIITNTTNATCVESENLIVDDVKTVEFKGFERVALVTDGFLADNGSLERLLLGNWNNLEKCPQHFVSDCSNLTEIDLRGLSNVRAVGNAFLSGCAKIQHIELMDMTNVKTIGTDFMKDCSSLTTVQNFKVNDTTVFEGTLFDGCTSLQHCDISSATSLKEENLPAALSAQNKRHPKTIILPRHLIVVELPKFTSNIAEFHQSLQQLPALILESDASQVFHEILESSAASNNFVQWMAYLRLYHWFINAIPVGTLRELGFKEANRHTTAEGGTLIYVPLTPTLPDVLMMYTDFKLLPMMPTTSSIQCRTCVKVPKANLYYSMQYDFGVKSSVGTVLRTPALLPVTAIASSSGESAYQYISSPYPSMFQRDYVADEPLNFAAVTGDPNKLSLWSELLEFHKTAAAHNLKNVNSPLMGEAFKERLWPLGFTIDNDYPANFEGTMCGKVIRTGEPVAVKRVAKPDGNEELPAVYKEWKEIDDIHIIPLRLCDVVAEHIVVVTPWAENRSLKDFAGEQLHPLSECCIRPFFRQALQGLHALKERGLSHGNIKLSNLIMFDGNSLKLTDMANQPPGNLDEWHSLDIRDLATAMMQLITLKLKQESFGLEDWATTTPDFKNLMNACLVTGCATAHQLLTESRWMEDRRRKATEDPQVQQHHHEQQHPQRQEHQRQCPTFLVTASPKLLKRNRKLLSKDDFSTVAHKFGTEGVPFNSTVEDKHNILHLIALRIPWLDREGKAAACQLIDHVLTGIDPLMASSLENDKDTRGNTPLCYVKVFRDPECCLQHMALSSPKLLRRIARLIKNDDFFGIWCAVVVSGGVPFDDTVGDKRNIIHLIVLRLPQLDEGARASAYRLMFLLLVGIPSHFAKYLVNAEDHQGCSPLRCAQLQGNDYVCQLFARVRDL